MPRETAPPPETHCEFCGAEYASPPADAPVVDERPEPPPAPTAGADEPEAHCEFCGAEYPVPGDRADGSG